MLKEKLRYGVGVLEDENPGPCTKIRTHIVRLQHAFGWESGGSRVGVG
jgi:hypothetical protein